MYRPDDDGMGAIGFLLFFGIPVLVAGILYLVGA